METIVKTDRTGQSVKYTLTREKGFMTNHIWVYRNRLPYLHIMPGDGYEFCKVFKNVPGRGYQDMGDLLRPFDEITLSDVCAL